MRSISAVLISTVFTLTACSSADPKEVSDLAESIAATDSPLGIPLPEDQAECLAKAYLEAGLSDEALNNLKNGQPLAPATEDDNEAIRKIAEKAPECV